MLACCTNLALLRESFADFRLWFYHQLDCGGRLEDATYKQEII